MTKLLAALLLSCIAVPAVALAADREPKKRLVPADEKRAAAVVLKRSDFAPGWKRVASTGDDGETPRCAGYDPDGSDLTLTGDAQSNFERAGGIPSVWSYADVYVSARDAAASWRRTVKPALARCLGELLQREAADDGVTLTIVKHGRISLTRVAPRTAAFRVVMRMTVTDGGTRRVVPLALHLVVVGRGRAEAGLAAFATGQGIPAPALRGFARVLAMRLATSGF